MLILLKQFFTALHIVYFIIGLILYTLLDICWVYFINGVENNKPKMAALASSSITFIVFVVSWIMYVEKSVWGLCGALIGSALGAYIGCIKTHQGKK